MLFSYLAFVFNLLYLSAFLANLQKSQNKDFEGAIVQKQYDFKWYCEVTIEELQLQKTGSPSFYSYVTYTVRRMY